MVHDHPAIVVGLCVHGLAIARALGKAGVKVYGIEQSSSVPGAHTRLVDVTIVSDINGARLIDALVEFGQQFRSDVKPVLILTNDNMVTEVGKNWQRLKDYYLMSWHHCIDQVLKLQLKNELEPHCVDKGILYPKSWLIDEEFDVSSLKDEYYPLILKPVKPLSSFKTLKVQDYEELKVQLEKVRADFPLLAQNFIEGGDESLFFCALYLRHGETVASYTGQKLASHPPAMGQTLIATGTENKDVEALTTDFFSGLDISGPVSLELKVDPKGNYWVIEPTVGRTDFWADLVIQSGINLPLIEYLDTLEQPIVEEQTQRVVWFDTEKDRFAYVKACIRQRTLKPWDGRPVLPFYGHKDIRPLLVSLVHTVVKLCNSVRARLSSDKD